MTMYTAWSIWGLLFLLSFVALESYAGVSGARTLSQTVWDIQDSYPWTTFLFVGGLSALLIHLVGHRFMQIEIIGRVVAKFVSMF